MAAQILYRAAAAAFVLSSVADAQIPVSLQALEAFKMRSWIAETVTQAQQHPGRKAQTALSPRMASTPVLTGTEGITVESFRLSVRAGEHYTSFDSHQSVLRELESLSASSGGSSVFTYTGYLLGWCNLTSNWARATLLYDKTSADHFMRETINLEKDSIAGQHRDRV